MNRITEFADSFIPKNIPKRKAIILKEEIVCHITDKADFYREIGYGDTESVNKAIEDFCTDENDKNFIFNEFEELYSERSILGIGAFLFIAFMNFICFPLDLWVMSADYNRDPDPISVFISFMMIFAVLIMISFARVKNFRKTLISIGMANVLIVSSLLFAFYQQMAAYAAGYNIIYLTDLLTPFSLGHIVVMANDGILIMALWYVILLVPALYCFVEAVRIKKGTAKAVKNSKKKIAIFSIVFFLIAAASSLLYPVSQKYVDDYPVWLDNYYNYISEESQRQFDEIAIGDSYVDVSSRLESEGYITIEEYENSLDRLTKKQFRYNLREFDFAKGYEIRFAPDKNERGNGFVGIKHENGIITAKAIGNLEESMYDEKNNNFGYSRNDMRDNMQEVFDCFGALNFGDSETDVMSRFGSEFGFIYAKRCSVQDNKTVNYYRIHCYGVTDPEAKPYYNRDDSRYIELTFENGTLVSGTMYDKVYLDKGSEVIYEKIK